MADCSGFYRLLFEFKTALKAAVCNIQPLMDTVNIIDAGVFTAGFAQDKTDPS